MGIQLSGKPKLHWNYFLALERDLETVSRYVEFTPDNYKIHSIELAHDPSNIDGYKPIITEGGSNARCGERLRPTVRTHADAVGPMEQE